MGDERVYYPGLDFLKFASAIVILLEHYYGNTGLPQLSVIRNGGIAVDLFFMISGFLCVGGGKNRIVKTSYSEYIFRIAGRFVPMVSITVTLYAVFGTLYYMCFGEWYRSVIIDFWNILTSYLLIFKGGAVGNLALGVNNPIWFLCVLLICYSLFYMIMRMTNKYKWPVIYGFLCMIFIGLAASTYALELPFLNGAVGRGYYSFFMGCIIAILMEKSKDKRKLYFLAFVQICVYILPLLSGLDFLYNNWTLSIVFILFTAMVVIGTYPLPAWLNGISRFLAGISFEIYIWQGIFFIIQGMLYHRGIIEYTRKTFFAFFLIVILFSAGVYVFAERKLNLAFANKIDKFLMNNKEN